MRNLLSAALILLMACQGEKQPSKTAADSVPPGGSTGNAVDTVVATVTYRQRIALPTGAHVMVALIDVARADAPAHVISAEDRVTTGDQVPFTFALPYVLGQIPMNARLSVQARIEKDGKLLFLSTQTYPVVTQGALKTVELVLEQVKEK